MRDRKLYGYLIAFWLGGITMLYILALAYPQGQPIANAAPPTVSDNCELFATVGDTNLYRCEDPETGNMCYLNPLAAGIIDCVEY